MRERKGCSLSLFLSRKMEMNVEQCRVVENTTGILCLPFMDILTAILYGTMFSSDIASAAFRVSSSLCKQQTVTKKIDFLQLTVQSVRIMCADTNYTLSARIPGVSFSLRIADLANATNGKRRSPTGDQ